MNVKCNSIPGGFLKSDLSTTSSLQTYHVGKKWNKERCQDLPASVIALGVQKWRKREGTEGDLVIAWKAGFHWVLNWKSYRKRKAPGSYDQGCAGLASCSTECTASA